MNKVSKNPFRNLKLTAEEKEIEKAVESGKYEVADDLNSFKKLYKQSAKNTLAKLKNINIRLNIRDLEKLKTKAAENGLPYQTLAASILHQYSNDKIKATL
ncbi:antitoxin [Candidatus Shapirobacteria bacterium]|nr:antitoxin [Candidatus Shapirobacteria bacterium]